MMYANFTSLSLTLGNRSMRCPTFCIHAVVSREGRGKASVAARLFMRKHTCS